VVADENKIRLRFVAGAETRADGVRVWYPARLRALFILLALIVALPFLAVITLVFAMGTALWMQNPWGLAFYLVCGAAPVLAAWVALFVMIFRSLTLIGDPRPFLTLDSRGLHITEWVFVNRTIGWDDIAQVEMKIVAPHPVWRDAGGFMAHDQVILHLLDREPIRFNPQLIGETPARLFLVWNEAWRKHSANARRKTALAS